MANFLPSRTFWIVCALTLAACGRPAPQPAKYFVGNAQPNAPDVSLPLAFVPGANQAQTGVAFRARTPEGSMAFMPAQVAITLRNGSGLRVQFEGANADATIAGEDARPGRINFFTGDDPSQWRTNLPSYGRIVYHDLYAGIDLHYDGTAKALKGTYHLSPGADPARIRWRYAGAKAISIEATSGDLAITLNDGATLTERAPVAWQEFNGFRVPVSARFVRFVEKGGGDGATLGFELGDYDPRLLLVVDPTIEFASYLGGTGGDSGEDIAVDAVGNIYLVGTTSAEDFPLKNPLYNTKDDFSDIFVAKIAADGQSLIYSTYIGGNFFDEGRGIAVDAAGNVYVVGATRSTNFPVSQNAYQKTKGGGFWDAFALKLDANGAPVYSTYLGGSEDDEGFGVAADADGNAYLTGFTASADDFPITQGAAQLAYGGGLHDAFLVKLNADGSNIGYGTFLGGNNNDEARDLALDANRNAFIAGFTRSPNFPSESAYQPKLNGALDDAFVAKFNPAGSDILYATYLGGSGNDQAEGLALDGQGNAYLTGFTRSPDFPLQSAAQTDCKCNQTITVATAFVSKLSASGTALGYSTFLGGVNADVGYSVAVDANGNAFVTGDTYSDDFPTKNALQAAKGGPTYNDVFVTQLNPAGGLAFSTYLGGANDINGEAGSAIALDSQGNMVVTGQSNASNFPTKKALQGARGPGTFGDAVFVKLSDGGYKSFLPIIRK